jgi:hypothetical protein
VEFHNGVSMVVTATSYIHGEIIPCWTEIRRLVAFVGNGRKPRRCAVPRCVGCNPLTVDGKMVVIVLPQSSHSRHPFPFPPPRRRILLNTHHRLLRHYVFGASATLHNPGFGISHHHVFARLRVEPVTVYTLY